MASNFGQQHMVGDKPADGEKEMQQHFTTISKSIGIIVKNSTNDQFKSDVCHVLNSKEGCRMKTIRTKTMKLMKENYSQQVNRQVGKNSSKERMTKQ